MSGLVALLWLAGAVPWGLSGNAVMAAMYVAVGCMWLAIWGAA